MLLHSFALNTTAICVTVILNHYMSEEFFSEVTLRLARLKQLTESNGVEFPCEIEETFQGIKNSFERPDEFDLSLPSEGPSGASDQVQVIKQKTNEIGNLVNRELERFKNASSNHSRKVSQEMNASSKNKIKVGVLGQQVSEIVHKINESNEEISREQEENERLKREIQDILGVLEHTEKESNCCVVI